MFGWRHAKAEIIDGDDCKLQPGGLASRSKVPRKVLAKLLGGGAALKCCPDTADCWVLWGSRQRDKLRSWKRRPRRHEGVESAARHLPDVQLGTLKTSADKNLSH